MTPSTVGVPPCAPPDFSPRKPKLRLPKLACDTHAHILGPIAKHAYSQERVYTPPDCLLGDYQHMLATLGVERAVLVQPSVYGTDNTVMLEALRTDWPHVMVKSAMPNDGDLCDLLAAWIPDAPTREQVLVGNPAKLYGF